jgi:hypothetical protein
VCEEKREREKWEGGAVWWKKEGEMKRGRLAVRWTGGAVRNREEREKEGKERKEREREETRSKEEKGKKKKKRKDKVTRGKLWVGGKRWWNLP